MGKINEKIYIAGPMSGIKDFNFQSFDLAYKKLSKLYRFVVNPYTLTDINEFSAEKYYEYLFVDLKELVTCDCIYMLKGWENSFGATIEHQFAKHKKMKIIYEVVK